MRGGEPAGDRIQFWVQDRYGDLPDHRLVVLEHHIPKPVAVRKPGYSLGSIMADNWVAYNSQLAGKLGDLDVWCSRFSSARDHLAAEGLVDSLRFHLIDSIRYVLRDRPHGRKAKCHDKERKSAIEERAVQEGEAPDLKSRMRGVGGVGSYQPLQRTWLPM